MARPATGGVFVAWDEDEVDVDHRDIDTMRARYVVTARRTVVKYARWANDVNAETIAAGGRHRAGRVHREQRMATTGEDLVAKGMRIFRTILDRQQRGVCAYRLSRFRGTEADYCDAPVAGPGASYCEPHRAIVDAEAVAIEARMTEEDEWPD